MPLFTISTSILSKQTKHRQNFLPNYPWSVPHPQALPPIPHFPIHPAVVAFCLMICRSSISWCRQKGFVSSMAIETLRAPRKTNSRWSNKRTQQPYMLGHFARTPMLNYLNLQKKIWQLVSSSLSFTPNRMVFRCLFTDMTVLIDALATTIWSVVPILKVLELHMQAPQSLVPRSTQRHFHCSGKISAKKEEFLSPGITNIGRGWSIYHPFHVITLDHLFLQDPQKTIWLGKAPSTAGWGGIGKNGERYQNKD